MVKVAVVLPVYNGERGKGPYILQQSIQSILDQTLEDFRLIIVNDGSTDRTRNIIDPYAAADKRVEIVNLPVNMGVTHAENEGIRRAGTYGVKYLCFQGSDDISLPTRLELQAQFLDIFPDIAMVGCCYRAMTWRGDTVGNYLALPSRHERIYNNLIHGKSDIRFPMIRWSVGDAVNWLDGKNFPYRAQDLDFALRVAEKYKVSILQEILYAYRQPSDDYQECLSYDMPVHIECIEKAMKLSAQRRQSKCQKV